MSVYVEYLFPQKLLFNKIMKLLRQENPSLYATILKSSTLTRAFANFSVKSIQSHALQELSTDVVDEQTALKKYTLLLQLLFGSIMMGFGNMLSESHSKANTFEISTDHSSSCPICLESACDLRLSCCKNMIHMNCFIDYRVNGCKQCPLCRCEI